MAEQWAKNIIESYYYGGNSYINMTFNHLGSNEFVWIKIYENNRS